MNFIWFNRVRCFKWFRFALGASSALCSCWVLQVLVVSAGVCCAALALRDGVLALTGFFNFFFREPIWTALIFGAGPQGRHVFFREHPISSAHYLLALLMIVLSVWSRSLAYVVSALQVV